MSVDTVLLSRANVYAKRQGMRIGNVVALGHGMDGAVWASTRESAIKVIRNRKNYADELECYVRLQAEKVRELCGFAVPFLEDYDNELMVVEMSIVQKPFVLDFGKVYLDGGQFVAYQAQELARSRAAAQAMYGDQWPRVALLLHVLEERFGIYYVDPRPGNIDCGPSTKDDPDWDKEPSIDYTEYD
jgi:hypothetical protein